LKGALKVISSNKCANVDSFIYVRFVQHGLGTFSLNASKQKRGRCINVCVPSMMLANSSFLCYAVKPGTVSVSTKADLRLRGFASFWQAVVLNIWRVVTFKGVVLMGQVFICLVFFFVEQAKVSSYFHCPCPFHLILTFWWERHSKSFKD